MIDSLQASSRGHEARFFFVTSRNHVTVMVKFLCGAHRRVSKALANLVTGGFAIMIFQLAYWQS